MDDVREHPREQSRPARLLAAEQLAARLDRPMGVLGLLFLLVVLGQVVAEDPALATLFAVLGWLFWAVFVAEFLLRAYVAGFRAEFWRRNWWQAVFLAVPFLRFFRALTLVRFSSLARLARVGGVVSAGVRGSRSAGRLLSSRVGWLASITAVVILASSQLYYLASPGRLYVDALHETAMATITGAGLAADDLFARLLEVVLAVYSVVIFATLAGTLGAFFLERRNEQAGPDGASGDIP